MREFNVYTRCDVHPSKLYVRRLSRLYLRAYFVRGEPELRDFTWESKISVVRGWYIAEPIVPQDLTRQSIRYYP